MGRGQQLDAQNNMPKEETKMADYEKETEKQATAPPEKTADKQQPRLIKDPILGQEVGQQAVIPTNKLVSNTTPLIIKDPVLGEMALSHTPNGEVNATVDLGHRFESLPIQSDRFTKVIARKFHVAQGDVPKKSKLKKIIRKLEYTGLFDGNKIPLHNRYAKIGNTIYVDLCNRQGHYVRIDPDGYSIHRHDINSMFFLRQPSMKEQVKPQKDGSIKDLRPFLNIQNEVQFALIVAFILGAMYPAGPFPMLTLHGPQGASKSTMLRVIRSIIDPSEAPLTSEPSSERDLFISASNTPTPPKRLLTGISSVSIQPAKSCCRQR